METKTIMLHKNAWKLLNGARNKKDSTREALENIYINAAGITVTNGRMLVTLDADQAGVEGGINTLEPGAYSIIAEGKPGSAGYMDIIISPSDLQFPDYTRVIPEAGPAAELKNITIPASPKRDALAFTRALIDVYRHTESAFSLEWIQVLGLYSDTWQVNKPGKGKAARFTALGALAIVLPFSMH